MASRPMAQSLSLHGHMIEDVNSSRSTVTRQPSPEAKADIAVGDWDALFHAVKERLIRIAHTADTSPKPVADHVAVQIRTDLLDCVAALDQLQGTVSIELERRETLELQVFDAKASLAQIRTALLDTQDGDRKVLHCDAHDSLTLLPNRGVLVERITHALGRFDSRHRGFAVMFLDLDGFKPINDAHGQAAGDELLQIVAARLRCACAGSCQPCRRRRIRMSDRRTCGPRFARAAGRQDCQRHIGAMHLQDAAPDSTDTYRYCHLTR